MADEIVLMDRNEELVHGQLLDLAHGQAFFPTVAIRSGDRTDYADAEVIVITAGAAQRQGESRLELCQRNAAIMRAIIADVVGEQSAAVVVVVSNPVDVMTQVAIACTDWPRGRVFGSGTVLDSARLRHQLSQYCGVDVHNVHAYVLGEHGDSEFAAWSMTHVGGMPIDLYIFTTTPACGSQGGGFFGFWEKMQKLPMHQSYPSSPARNSAATSRWPDFFSAASFCQVRAIIDKRGLRRKKSSCSAIKDQNRPSQMRHHGPLASSDIFSR